MATDRDLDPDGSPAGDDPTAGAVEDTDGDTGTPGEDPGEFDDPADGGSAAAEHEENLHALYTLTEATKEMVAAETTEDIVAVVLEAAVEVLGFDQTGIHLHDEDEGALVPVDWSGTLEEELGEPPALGPDSVAWSVFESGEVVCVDDYRDPDGEFHNPDTPFHSEMIVPLGGHGVLLSASTEPDTFDDRDRHFAEVLCPNAAAAMDRIGRKADLREREREIERQNDLLASLTEDVEGSVDDLAGTAERVSTSSRQISTLAEGQAASMEDITSEITDLTAVVEEIASLSDRVEATSDEALSLAEDGRRSATDATETMGDIEGSTAEATAEFDDLHDQIDEIDEIVEVINDVADQTNMLALNANIEAARAGEAGQGFAVVADEVKSLAEETQEQAGRIEARVEEIQANSTDTVETLKRAMGQVQAGMEQVERTRQSLEDIVEAVTETAQGIEEVADATDDQAASSEEIASMVDDATATAERVSEEIRGIAAANREQVQRVEEIRESLERTNRRLDEIDGTSRQD